MKKYSVLVLLVMGCTLFGMCRKAEKLNEDTYDQRLSAGLATVFDETSKAFGNPIPGLNERDARVHSQGDAGFSQTMISDPTKRFGGLGPIFNNVSCISCHHNDGKGTPTTGLVNSSMLMRITSNIPDAHGGPGAITGYGNQVQDLSTISTSPEAKVSITYTDRVITYPDGQTVTLRVPGYVLNNMYLATGSPYTLSPRMAPPVFGLGLLEIIPESTIEAFAVENKTNPNGIRGHVNRVYDPQTQQMALGRFGLKANTSTLYVQVATAYQQDMGITNTLQTKESCYDQSQWNSLASPVKIDLPDSTLNAVVYYVKSLAVPARRNVADPTVVAGQAIFKQLNCDGCHRSGYYTGVDFTLPQISNQRINPYTDMLLHDMGTGLADGYQDYLATGSEWRTPALWGIGLYEKTNGTPFYLHDGRARTIEEAILWHGGEAEKVRNNFMQLSADQRQALIKFIKSL